MWDNYDLLLGDKHQSFLQADSIVFTGYYQACPKYPKRKFVILLQYPKKEEKNGEMDLIFCIQINIKVPYKLRLLILLGMARPA